MSDWEAIVFACRSYNRSSTVRSNRQPQALYQPHCRPLHMNPYTTLQYTTLQYTTLQYTTLQYITLQHIMGMRVLDRKGQEPDSVLREWFWG